MRTRRTKEQIRKDIYNKDVDAYNFYVVNLDTKRAETGFEFKEDAVDLLNDYDDKKKYKVVSKRALKAMGIENPNESFKYEDGGKFQSMTREEFMKKEIESQKEKEISKVFKKFRVVVYEQKKSGGYPFTDFETDNFIEGVDFAKKMILQQKNYRPDSEYLWVTISKFTPIEERGNVRYPYYEIARFGEEDLETSKYELGGDFQAGVYAGGGSIKESDIKVGEKFKLMNGEVIEIKRLFTENMDENWVEYTRNGKSHEGSVNSLKIFINNWREGKSKYAKGGSLEAHGIQVGDTFIKTVSGAIQKVKDKNGKIFYINLSTGERDAQPPLPFENGGKVSDDLFENYDKQPKKLAEIVENYMSKFDEGDYDYQDSKNFLKEVEAVGYTFDYGLDNEPYGLRPIGTKLKGFENGGDLGIEEEIDLTDDKKLRVRKPAMPEKKLTRQEWAEKHNASAYEYMAKGGSLPSGSINALSDLWFAVQQKDTDDYKMIANQLDKLNVPYAIQNEVSANAETQRGRKALNIPEVHERITRIVERNKRKFATGGALIGNQKRIDLNKNGKIDAEDFKLLRTTMNGAWRNEHQHVNSSNPKQDYEVRYARKTKSGRTGYKGKTNFATGGGFQKLSNRVAKNYEGKRVKPQYQKEYGKVYSKSEAKEVGNKVAGKVKASQKMTTGGQTKKGGQGGIMVLAKKIRKDGESWQDALKRAGQQLK
jgi:hypothetical protein